MSAPKNPKNPWNKPVNADRKFQEAKKQHENAVKKFALDLDSSDEEELEQTNIMDSVLQKYQIPDGNIDLGRTANFLNDVFQSGANICLICISSIKRNESIWTCTSCYCFFHLECIQRWSKDTILQQRQALEAQVQTRKITMKWCCPKCRHDYDPKEIPMEYFCFCGKVKNPQYESLQVPHSCGNACGKDLQPNCGHKCLLLCHPGPCPPCPKTVAVTCYCEASKPKMQRCTNKEWSCGSPCSKLLACGKHKCAQMCHSGSCPACPKKSLQKCLCKGNVKLRDCSTPLWQCEKVCEKRLSCGHHNCQEVCHIEPCDVCPGSKVRKCPCGKTEHQLPCYEEVPTCGDTCGKLLDCVIHPCNERCHKGKCQMCLETVVKKCRCGLHSKEIQCQKTYQCETKCKRLRDCGKHTCNRKCCDKNCPPCDKSCGKTLSCKKHSCASACHQGPCYPCTLTEKVSCFCGATVMIVPCGRKSRTKSPKCLSLCRIKPECHHKEREKHRCHFGECPPCKQICNKQLNDCSHKCLSGCHSATLVKIEAPKASTPWDERGPFWEKQNLPCPPCPVPIPITCFGAHETSDLPCHRAVPFDCGRSCGRTLLCGNHICCKSCHVVEGSTNASLAGKNCEVCSLECIKPRPEGCVHSCPEPCHSDDCPPCKLMLRITCHCGLSQPYVNCYEWTIAVTREILQSCGNQCPFNYPCGHRCKSNCHSGVCPNAEECRKKVKVFCDCKRIKKEFVCDVVRKGEAVIGCDNVCQEKLLEENKRKELENLVQQQQQEIKNKSELEKFDKLFGNKKKNRSKKKETVVDERSYFKVYVGACFALVLGVFVAYYLNF